MEFHIFVCYSALQSRDLYWKDCQPDCKGTDPETKWNFLFLSFVDSFVRGWGGVEYFVCCQKIKLQPVLFIGIRSNF